MATSPDNLSRFDVAVIGYGPTGATLANLLVQCGLKVVVIEREADIYHLPRAVHFDDETMRVFQTAGIADQLKAKVRVNLGMRFVDTDRRLLLDWPRPQEVGPHGWHPSYRFHQPDLETLLRQALVNHDEATVLTNCEVTGLTDLDDHVDITCRDRPGGETRMIRASYVVGCDGARSIVCQAIRSGIEDLGFCERWLVVDVLLKRDRPDLGDHTMQICNPARPMTYCRSPENRRRWEIAVLEHETDSEITKPARVWDLLSDWISPDDATLERSAVYTFQSVIADTWRRGRLLIAGDAAHLTPPFMGQGMCAGIRDAANLGWKLALCVKGRADPALLDSYQSERSPNVRSYITTAIRLGGLVNSLDRDSAMVMAQNTTGGAKMASIAPRLGDSELVRGCTPKSLHCGVLFGQPTLIDGRKMDDVCGYAPVLISRRSLQSPPRSGMQMLNAADEPVLMPFLNDLGVNAVLVRPDRYILTTAQSDDEIGALLDIDLPSPIHPPERNARPQGAFGV
jgi:3-(3-hydroxy-phenyl)propionate hydroxylase